MGDHDDIQHPLSQGDPAVRHGRELTANSGPAVSDSLTFGVTAPESVLSADTGQAGADAAPRPVTVAAVSKVSVSQAERSQGSFAALNKLLHNFTSGSPKGLKKEVKKGSALTDAQVCMAQRVGYANHAAALITHFKSCAAKAAAEKHHVWANSYTYIQAVVHAFHASQQGLHFKPCEPPHHVICLTTRAACRLLASATPPKKTLPAVLFTSCIVAPTT